MTGWKVWRGLNEHQGFVLAWELEGANGRVDALPQQPALFVDAVVPVEVLAFDGTARITAVVRRSGVPPARLHEVARGDQEQRFSMLQLELVPSSYCAWCGRFSGRTYVGEPEGPLNVTIPRCTCVYTPGLMPELYTR